MKKIINVLILFLFCVGIFSQIAAVDDRDVTLEGLGILETRLQDLQQREFQMKAELQEIEKQMKELDRIFEQMNKQLQEFNN